MSDVLFTVSQNLKTTSKKNYAKGQKGYSCKCLNICCGAVQRSAASITRCPQFESSHRPNFIHNNFL